MGCLLNKCTKHSLKQNQVHPRRTTHGNKHTKNKKETNKTNTHTHTHTNKELLMRQSIKQAKPNKQTNKQATKAWAMCL